MKARKKPVLATAQLLFAQQKYGQVISLLLPQIVLYRKEAGFHEILGFSCLYTGDFGGAYSYLQRARDIESQRIPTLLGLAIVMLRRRKLTEAVGIWLDVLDIEPQNRQAKKALNMARELSENDWLQLIEDGRYRRILPLRASFLFYRLPPRLTIAAVLAGITIVVALFFLVPQAQKPLPYRVNANLLEFDQSDYTQADYSQFASTIFTERELEKKIATIRQYFHQFRDNMVRFHGNQVLMSNAPLKVKDHISLIITQLKTPDFTNYQDPFDYEQVVSDPLRYNGVYIRWKGRVANLVVSDELMSLDLLVGFDTGRVVRGTIPVILDFAVSLQGGESVEVIARVNITDGAITLTASSIRLLASNNSQ